jgi:hypothetical protein
LSSTSLPTSGHPELDLTLVDYFDPVRDDEFDAYRDIALEPGSPNAAIATRLWDVEYLTRFVDAMRARMNR